MKALCTTDSIHADPHPLHGADVERLSLELEGRSDIDVYPSTRGGCTLLAHELGNPDPVPVFLLASRLEGLLCLLTQHAGVRIRDSAGRDTPCEAIRWARAGYPWLATQSGLRLGH